MFVAAVRRNPVARRTTWATFQQSAAKWLCGARDRCGGHKARNEATRRRRKAVDNEEDN